MADEIIKKQITKEGYDELQNELSERKTKKRSEIAARIEDAKAQGDLSENSPVGRAISNQKKGKTVSVSTPSGIIKYKIIKIEK